MEKQLTDTIGFIYIVFINICIQYPAEQLFKLVIGLMEFSVGIGEKKILSFHQHFQPPVKIGALLFIPFSINSLFQQFHSQQEILFIIVHLRYLFLIMQPLEASFHLSEAFYPFQYLVKVIPEFF